MFLTVTAWLPPLAAYGAASGADADDLDPDDAFVRMAVEPRGWSELTERITEFAARDDLRDPFVCAPGDHMVAQAEWLTQRRLPGFPLRPRHRHQYGLSTQEAAFLGRDALDVDEDLEPRWLHVLDRAFDAHEVLPPVEVTIGDRTVERFHIVRCTGFRGMP